MPTNESTYHVLFSPSKVMTVGGNIGEVSVDGCQRTK